MSGLDEMPDSVRLKRSIEKFCNGITIDITFTEDFEPVVDMYEDYVPIGDWHIGTQDYFTVIEVVGTPNSGMSYLGLGDALERCTLCQE